MEEKEGKRTKQISRNIRKTKDIRGDVNVFRGLDVPRISEKEEEELERMRKG